MVLAVSRGSPGASMFFKKSTEIPNQSQTSKRKKVTDISKSDRGHPSYRCQCKKGLWGDGTSTCYEGYIAVLNGMKIPWSHETDWKTPVLIDGKGKKYALDCLTMGSRTISSNSCSVVWNNQVYVYNKLISRLAGVTNQNT